jgi:hypothetical protein
VNRHVVFFAHWSGIYHTDWREVGSYLLNGTYGEYGVLNARSLFEANKYSTCTQTLANLSNRDGAKWFVVTHLLCI